VERPTPAKRNERYFQSSTILWVIVFIVVIAFVGIVAFALGHIVGSSPHFTLVEEATAIPEEICQIDTLSAREVYNEPENFNSRVGTLEAGFYRVIAFGGQDWVSVDWNGSGLEASTASLQQLDWIQVQLGVDLFLGDCRDVPILGVRVRDDDQ